jgi:hypothetical protein
MGTMKQVRPNRQRAPVRMDDVFEYLGASRSDRWGSRTTDEQLKIGCSFLVCIVIIGLLGVIAAGLKMAASTAGDSRPDYLLASNIVGGLACVGLLFLGSLILGYFVNRD